MSVEKRKALIIGSGIAGPAVAMFLQRAGIDAEVYEAQPDRAVAVAMRDGPLAGLALIDAILLT
jgi:2-polyprenyl-6-methoxyphenol hydroxylase-like FAD-dependent oxidoreductase